MENKSNFENLKDQIAADGQYAWSWHCSLAMQIKDSINCSHMDANKAATHIMKSFFNIDTSSFEEYKWIENNAK